MADVRAALCNYTMQAHQVPILVEKSGGNFVLTTQINTYFSYDNWFTLRSKPSIPHNVSYEE